MECIILVMTWDRLVLVQVPALRVTFVYEIRGYRFESIRQNAEHCDAQVWQVCAKVCEIM